MIKLYTNREVAKTLQVNLAKWKRWSREFLLPDPLAGLRSGFSRQYYIHDVFTVYLGGYLVAELKFSIAEARQILQDMEVWLDEKGFHSILKGAKPTIEKSEQLIQSYSVFILKNNHSDFFYRVRGFISSRQVLHEGFQVTEEKFIDTWIPKKCEDQESMDMGKILPISFLFERFKKQIETVH